MSFQAPDLLQLRFIHFSERAHVREVNAADVFLVSVGAHSHNEYIILTHVTHGCVQK